MSSTDSFSTASSSATTATSSTADNEFSFSIRETTIRNIAIAVGISLTVLLICTLIAIEVMRRKMKRMRRQLDVYAMKLEGLSPRLRTGHGYHSVPPSAVENGSIPRFELDGSREVVESDARFLGSRSHRRDESFVLKLDSQPSSPQRSSSRERLR
ncbi:uncharacterized protein MYCFIDRAFT_210105 [Pseudocercospora fijiensis CIRAD86]|uniref:Uncharacterized protein n=1 Tax=Pseudocercospora fijiensis (strain CIRAD86) TaxID=383855 RepID=N1QCZ1_PSEFD|nr:uncharacterized protein MYCFIDRAFT_210105 [Pseudocercospora fijiensis CIRAD86]EME89473.1 hypothetical protein MYCFIDRAFT_210105 [Pseudocercospora fijiensis CIRAD86]